MQKYIKTINRSLKTTIYDNKAGLWNIGQKGNFYMAFISIVILLVIMYGTIAALIATLIIMFIGSFVLQGFLSNMKNPWAGLILPACTFGFLLCLSIIAHDITICWILMSRGNICTAVYLLIYFFFRRRKKRRCLASNMNAEK